MVSQTAIHNLFINSLVSYVIKLLLSTHLCKSMPGFMTKKSPTPVISKVVDKHFPK